LAPEAKAAAAGIQASTLPGLVLDDNQAKLTGKWTEGTGLPNYVGSGYRYRNAKDDGSARYEFKIDKPGRYEVRLNYGEHENRATNAPIAVESADGTKRVTLNERVKAPLPQGFVSLGTFRFEPGKASAVVIGAGPADGNVHADAVQLLPAP
jgi:hypothetical protein